MAYEALDFLRGTLNGILKQSHHPDINQEIISIHDETVFLQLHLANNPEKLEERIREAAKTTKEIIEYLFSEDNPLYGGWMKPTVLHSNKLREVADNFKSTGDVEHSINSKRRRLCDISPSVSSLPRTATTIKDAVVGFDQDLRKIKFPSQTLSLTNCVCTPPKMAYEALDSLRGTLNRILKQSHHPDINQEVISIHDETVFLQLHLAYSPENLKERIREAANATEEIIEYLFSEDNPLYGGWMKPTVEHSNQLREAAHKFKSTIGDVVHSINSKRRGQLSDISPSVCSLPRTTTTIKDVVVGFGQDLIKIKNQLTRCLPFKLKVLSIVGMGGTGKTTLTKLVYNDELIVNRFDIRAWVTVSQDYSVGNILVNLLASLERGIPVERDEQREIPREFLIRRYLEGGRFLIVIDDMCSKKAWDDLKMIFPRACHGDQIILTTRLHDVAAYVDSSSPVHTMRLLDARDSWNLLKQKVFADESCPLELEDVGKRIVKTCGGLPLSIVVVAGILCKVGNVRQLWKQIAANDGNLETIISLSYNHLPDYLRACLLYMGGFPEDYEIRVSELIKLWIAEGFISPNGSKSLEEEAEDCLENLVERSLVLVTSRKLDGKIKTCSLHDIVREFCVKQGARDKFFLSVVDFLPSPIVRRHFLPRLLKNHGRINATWHDLDFKDCVATSFTHSIICIPQRGYRSVGFVEKFGGLRVFHVLRRNDHWDWEAGQVFDLIHLTYLASSIPTSIVPTTISKLQNLQTLIIYSSEVVLPLEIWMLRQLRHLIAFSFNSLPHPDGVTLPLENLQTMSLVMDFVCSGRMVEMVPNIKKLGIGYFMKVFDERCCLDNLKQLCQLEKLKLEKRTRFSVGVSKKLNPVFPLSLKKLTLCALGLAWEDMTTIICSLPNLQVLKLRNYACSGECWIATEGEFGKLRLLLIEGSYLRYWTTKGRNFFRSLECLILVDCQNLPEIPSEIGDIPTLKLIEVDTALLGSAKRIQEKRRRSGNHSFQVRTNKRS